MRRRKDATDRGDAAGDGGSEPASEGRAIGEYELQQPNEEGRRGAVGESLVGVQGQRRRDREEEDGDQRASFSSARPC